MLLHKRVGFFVMMSMFALTVLSACSSSAEEEEQLTIMAAASLTDVMNELKEMYVEEHGNVKLLMNYGSSGQLRQQISQGAPADLFLSAAKSDMDKLEEAGDVAERQDLVMNQLALIATPDTAETLTSWDSLADGNIERLSVGRPDSVPAGKYAEQVLTELGMWDELKDDLIYASDVRGVLTYVETGNVDAGIVYHTDALTSDKVKVIANAPEGSHEPILYAIGLLNGAEDNDSARDLYEWLQSEEALEVLESYGYGRVQ
ncbi:molybdate ABC transporter substrate-binding protein [Jeotgalibacillus proteolyticus]|uniref:Molybdate ABC transporter substrate-binding protein n=1 Tax=Jeotgalibacillus proteolyticus TaxID=2082395 RepID=A0A2S5GC00_9BACL|nr:molybdate ABC transporter substrate-binding protein [Jeotgalibacillus proteolyticus]PPA70423.1 molybdate ABC transporter substrate-binding protein [Jeotgalibacillus proteolyticus]